MPRQMKEKPGFITLPRKIMDHDLFRSEKANRRTAFEDLIMLATYEPIIVSLGDGDIKLDRGQLAYSMKHLGEIWGRDRRTVRAYLDKFKNRGMIDFYTTNKTTVITIIDYDVYQGNVHQNGHQRHANMNNSMYTNNNTKNINKNNKKGRYKEVIGREEAHNEKKEIEQEEEENFFRTKECGCEIQLLKEKLEKGIARDRIKKSRQKTIDG